MKYYIDLHLHLDGSVPIETIQKLMIKDHYPTIPLATLKDKLSVSDSCKNLNEYLTKFDFPVELMQTRENLEIIVFDLLKKLRTQGMIYCELRFAPQLHIKHGLSQNQAIEACLNGLDSFYSWQNNQKDNQPDLHANFLLCLMRFDNNYDENLETVLLAKKYQNQAVIGIDLAGPEGIIPNIKFKPLFDNAKKLGLNYTIHAGEADGPNSIRQALIMGARRIGHGVRCLEDPSLLSKLAFNNVTLECCATSNLNTKIFTELNTYPIRKLLDNHIRATLNCDNMTVSNTNLAQEFRLLEMKTGLTKFERHQLLYNSITAAFTNNNEKQRLYNLLVNP